MEYLKIIGVRSLCHSMSVYMYVIVFIQTHLTITMRYVNVPRSSFSFTNEYVDIHYRIRRASIFSKINNAKQPKFPVAAFEPMNITWIPVAHYPGSQSSIADDDSKTLHRNGFAMLTTKFLQSR